MILLLLKKKKKVICDRRHALTSGGGSLPPYQYADWALPSSKDQQHFQKGSSCYLGDQFYYWGTFFSHKVLRVAQVWCAEVRERIMTQIKRDVCSETAVIQVFRAVSLLAQGAKRIYLKLPDNLFWGLIFCISVKSYLFWSRFKLIPHSLGRYFHSLHFTHFWIMVFFCFCVWWTGSHLSSFMKPDNKRKAAANSPWIITL